MIRLHSVRTATRQRGATLLVAMIFLVVLMLIVISAIKVTNVNTRVVGNMQTQQEATAASQQMIEYTISGDLSTTPPNQILAVDINNSGQVGARYSVSVQSQCIAVQPLKVTTDLDINNPADQPCFTSGSAQNTGIESANAAGSVGNSLCSNSVWDIQATTTPPNSTQPAAILNQGVTQRVDVGSNC
ncbi:pilus assembly PilX family protein [Acidovorax soli]|uniref:pilus assembly PilX family protein n=1 Tax=Acidovorax soli TaxID=592050 RepID=UPI0032B2BF71